MFHIGVLFFQSLVKYIELKVGSIITFKRKEFTQKCMLWLRCGLVAVQKVKILYFLFDVACRVFVGGWYVC